MIEGINSSLRSDIAMPPKIATTTVTRAMSARFLRLNMARRFMTLFL